MLNRVNLREVLLIALLGFLIYFNSLGGEFIWDDFTLVVNNPLIQDTHNFGRIFTSELSSGNDYYRPLQNLSYLVDYCLYKLNPFGFHLGNIILHILNSILVYLISRIITKNSFIALASSLLFISAPIHTETVAFISGRADLLLGAFMLIAFLSYIKGKAAVSLLFFMLSLLTKEQAVVFPIILILYDGCLKNDLRKRVKVYLPFILMGALYICARLTILNFSHNPLFYRRITFHLETGIFPRLLTFFKSVVEYLKIIVYPVNLHMERRIDIVKSILDPYVIIFFSAFILAIGAILKFKNKNPLILFGIFWFLAMLIPQSSLIFPQIIAEHFLYLPSMGIFLILGIILEKLWQKKRDLAIIILSSCVLFYSILTVTYNTNWQNPLRFYRWTLKFAPESFKVRYQLGTYYIEHRMHDYALREYRKAIQIYDDLKLSKPKSENLKYFYKINKPLLSTIHQNMGAILSQGGLLDDAESEYKQAIELNPKFAEAYNDLGCLYIKRGDFVKADNILNRALEVRPDFEKTYYNLGLIYLKERQTQKAILLWQKALSINPNYKTARDSLRRLETTK